MRIRSGSAKGREISAPKGLQTRPTSDKVKEAIFNVLALKLEDAEVLDLCAGSANLGLEALSRGALSAVFVEKNPKTCTVISGNISKTNFVNKSTLLKMDAAKALAYLNQNNRCFNIIFFDPPYHANLYKPVLDLIANECRSILKENAVLVVESSSKEELPYDINGLLLKKESLYGDTKISYYQF